MNFPVCLWSIGVILAGVTAYGAVHVELDSPDCVPGYLSRLLINENPFPGERGYLSVADTKAGMLQVLWVLHSRMKWIPPGYTQEQVAAIRSDDIVDIITAQGQCEGFMVSKSGAFTTVPRVEKRVQYLLKIANTGDHPGKFSDLLSFGRDLARSYLQGGMAGADRFAGLQQIGRIPVTGRAFSWMADRDYYKPGGNFISIPDNLSGSLGGNRFYTLKKISEGAE